MRATLYSTNYPLVDLDIEGRFVYKIFEVIDTVHLPIALQNLALQNRLSVESLNAWLQKRTIPDQREGLAAVRKLHGDFECYRHMASLTDPYWICFSPRESWSKINFFNNSYSSAIGEAQFMPWAVTRSDLHIESPDLTTNGLLPKVWVHDSQMQSYLVKAGSRALKQHPLSEVLATVCLHNYNLLPYVPYTLTIYGLKVCSKCPNFVKPGTEFVPAKAVYDAEPKIAGDTVYGHMIRAAEHFGIKKPGRFIDRMIMADALIGNADRHLGNFGYLRDTESGQLIDFAPLFDFGGAFSPYDSDARPRVFANQLPRVQRKFAHLFKPSFFVKHDELYSLIDAYPDLTQVEKEKIREGIRQRDLFFSQTITERGVISR